MYVTDERCPVLYQVGSGDSEVLVLVERKLKIIVQRVKASSGVVFLTCRYKDRSKRSTINLQEILLPLKETSRGEKTGSGVVLTDITGIKMVVKEVPLDPKRLNVWF